MSKIQLIHGSCADQNVDAVVNAANKYLAAGGGICGVLFSKAGYAALQHACNQYATPLNDGDAVMTPAFNIKNAKVIIHAVGPNFSVTPQAYDALAAAYYNALKVLMQNGWHSISFPLISSGIFGGSLPNPAATSAEMCLKAYSRFINNHPDYDIDVRLCAYSTDEYQTAQKVFEGAGIYGGINMEREIKYVEPDDYFPKEIRDKFFDQNEEETVADCGGIQPITIPPIKE